MTFSRTLFLIAAAFAAVLVLWPSKTSAGPDWWNKAWRYRRAVEVPQFSKESGEQFVWCSFGAGEELAPQGSDIRVLDESGNLAPYHVVYAEPGRKCEVVFKATTPGTYYVYYGNKKVGAGSKQFKLERGLVLETRKRPEGPCNSWRDYQRLLRNSTEVYGRGMRRKIFDGFNPYGPSDEYLSIYTGYIYTEQAGTYRFATNSDESSFVFIDGKKVVEWAGAHGPSGAYGEHNGAIDLTKGYHKLEYYHEESSGGQACVLGWWTPGSKQVALVPEMAFSAFLRGRTSAAEKQGTDTACDFVYQYSSDLHLPGNLYCEVAFFDYSRPTDSIKSWLWDFGDGLTSTEQKPVHIYLTPDFYTVRLTVAGPDGKKDSTSRTVYAGQLFINSPDDKRPGEYARRIRSYRWDRLGTNSMLAASSLLEFVEDYDSQTSVLKALVAQGARLSSAQRYEVLLKLGDLLRKESKDAEGALKAYQQILDESISRKRTLMGKIGVADVHFQLKQEYDKALEIYAEVVEKYEDVSLAYCRLAQIRIGDVRREQGDYKKALEAYEKAKKMRRLVSHLDDSLKRGELAMTIEAYLRQNEHDAALKKLDLWDWEYPEDKLSGYSSILRAKANYGLKKFDEVIKDLTSLVKVNAGPDVSTRSNYLAEAKYMTGYALLRQKKYQEASETLESMIDEHPESDLLDKAREVLDQCRKQLGK